MSRPTASRLTDRDLRRELSEYHERYPKLGDDELFVVWFLRAFVTENDDEAVRALCGGPRDKNVDAVLIDEPARMVFVVQGKYRKKLGAKAEHRGDVVGFAQLAVDLCGDGTAFAGLAKDLSPEVHRKLGDARNRVLKRGYGLQLFYVTLGTCSKALQEEADRVVRRADASRRDAVRACLRDPPTPSAGASRTRPLAGPCTVRSGRRRAPPSARSIPSPRRP